MSALKPTATPFLPTGSKSWADDDDEDDDITKDFAALSPKKETTRVEKPAEESKASTTQGKYILHYKEPKDAGGWLDPSGVCTDLQSRTSLS
jgi:hypothetical protein